MDVTAQPRPLRLCRVRLGVHPHVDHDGTGLDHVTRDHFGAPDRGNEDVRTARVEREVPGAAVAHRDRGISAGPSLHQQRGHRLPHDVAASDDHRLGTTRLHPAPQEQLDHPGGGTRHEPVGVSDEELADVHRMEPVNILFWKNVPNDRVGIDVPGQWHLHEDAVHGRIGVEPFDHREQCILTGGGRQANGFALHARGLGGFLLGADIGGAGGIVAHEHNGEPGYHAPRRQCDHVGCHFVADRFRDRFSIDQFSAQNPPPGFHE